MLTTSRMGNMTQRMEASATSMVMDTAIPPTSMIGARIHSV